MGGIRLSGTLFPRGNDISPNFGIPLVAQLFPADFFQLETGLQKQFFNIFAAVQKTSGNMQKPVGIV